MDSVGYALARQVEPYRWQRVMGIPNYDSYTATEIIGNKAYVISPSYTQVYDFANARWEQEPPMPAERKRYNFATCLIGTKIYVIGGLLSSGAYGAVRFVDIYDTVQKTWTFGPDMPALTPEKLGLHQAGCASVNNSVYLFGGRWSGISGNSDAVYALDLTSGTWSQKGTMPFTLANMGIAQYDGQIYLFGGQINRDSYGGNDSNNIYLYNPTANSWTTKRTMNSARTGCRAVVFNDKVYILGGEGTVLVEEYAPSTNALSIKQGPTEIFTNFGAVKYGEAIYVFKGGYVSSYNSAGTSLDTLLAWLAVR